MLYCDTVIIKVKTGFSRRFTKSVLNLKLKLKKTILYYRAGGDIFFEGCVLQTNLNHLHTQSNTLSAGLATKSKRGNNLLIAAPIGTHICLAETGKIIGILNKKRPVLIAATQQTCDNNYTCTPGIVRLYLRYYILAHLSFFGLHNSGHFLIYRKISNLLLGTCCGIIPSVINTPVISKCLKGKFFSVYLPTFFLRAGVFYNTYYVNHSKVPKIIVYVVDICLHSVVVAAGLLGSFLGSLKPVGSQSGSKKTLFIVFVYKDASKYFLLEEKIKNIIMMLDCRLLILKTISTIDGLCCKDICRKCLLLLSKNETV